MESALFYFINNISYQFTGTSSAKTIRGELVWSGSVHHWLGENSSILLAVEISGRGSLYYKENAVNDAHSVLEVFSCPKIRARAGSWQL